jgi:hypothetical protein
MSAHCSSFSRLQDVARRSPQAVAQAELNMAKETGSQVPLQRIGKADEMLDGEESALPQQVSLIGMKEV